MNEIPEVPEDEEASEEKTSLAQTVLDTYKTSLDQVKRLEEQGVDTGQRRKDLQTVRERLKDYERATGVELDWG